MTTKQGRTEENMQNSGAFITNTYDPRREDAMDMFGEGGVGDWIDYLNYVETKIIGPPQATAMYSSEQLAKFGLVGLYESESG